MASHPPPVNVLHVLRQTRHEAQRNAAVLDHISTWLFSNASHLPPPANPPPNPSSRPADSTTSPAHPPQNGKSSHPSPSLSHPNQPAPSPQPNPSPPPRPAFPISKYILSKIFDALDKHHPTDPSPSNPHPNCVFVDHDQEHDFLYGLVLPVIARLLAVSSPGLLCVVQLPSPDAVPEWAAPPPSFDGSNGSNGSNGSKSFGHTTPSRHDTSRTPSPSDEGVAPRKSVSPESQARTAELIRHADQILSGAEATVGKRTAEGSPPPDTYVSNNRVLPFICNGFEVLTGKMPPPRYDMGSFTLASVGWEKAGIVAPDNSSKGVSMSFSNGMMTPTEGIVVTFSNGSMCFLTLKDPLTMLDSLKVGEGTPLIVFSFAHVGQHSVRDLMSRDREGLTEEATKIQALMKKPNLFFVEIGRTAGSEPNGSLAECTRGNRGSKAGERELRSQAKIEVPLPNGKKPTNPPKPLSQRQAPICPPVTVSVVPRAVPLFVNTINQTFIDPPFFQMPDSELDQEPFQERCNYPTNRAEWQEWNQAPAGVQPTPPEKHDLEEKRVRISEDCMKQEPEKRQATPTAGPEHGAEMKNGRIDTEVQQRTSPPADGQQLATGSSQAMEKSTSSPLSLAALQNGAKPHPHREHQDQQVAPMYAYYGYGHGHGQGPEHGHGPGHEHGHGRGHVYPVSGPQGHSIPQSQPGVGPSAGVHQAQPPINGAHPGYYHAMQSNTHIPNGHTHNHHAHSRHYAGHSYYSLPMPPGMGHPPGQPQSGSQWQQGVAAVGHRPPSLPPPHLVDARRDMPVYFSTHRAVVAGQYPSQYYSGPSHGPHGPVYGSQPSNFKAGPAVAAEHAGSASGPMLINSSNNGMSNGAGEVKASMDGGQGAGRTERACGDIARVVGSGAGENDDESKTAEIGGNRGRAVAREEDRNDTQSTDKEKALHALIQMGEGFRDSDSGEIGRKRGSDEGEELRRKVGGVGNVGGPGDELSGQCKDMPYASSEACNTAVGGESEGYKVAGKNGRVNSGRRHSSETSSSTSTNSQGAALLQGAVTGTSHVSRQGYSGSQPNRKRRKR